jgi:threonine dehydrogenase-like Zn-dependent dehydrogenase
MRKMLAGQITAPRTISWVEVDVPDPKEDQIVVQLEAAAICGSDLPYFLVERDHPAVGSMPLPFPPLYSLHELVGRVVRTRSRRYREGDRVLALPYLQQGLAECFLSETGMAVPIPDGPAERLVLSQPLGTVVHACLKLPNVLGWTAVVVGQGPIGQLFTALLRRMGALRVIGVDLLPERLEVSRRMGATHTLLGDSPDLAAQVREISAGAGADLAIEAVGYPETLNLAASLVRRNGTLLAFGIPHRAQYDFAFRDFFVNEGRLINSVGPDVQKEFPIAVELVATGAVNVGPLITHTYPLQEAQAGFSLFASRNDGAIKVVLKREGPGPLG